MKKTEDILYIVMPAYNEGDNITETVDAWMPVLDGKSSKSRLVIADSGSTDNTHELLLELKKKYPQLDILEHTNQYHGPKVIALYKYAIKNGADYIFQTDSDGQTNPEEFDAFWEERESHEAILGHRNKRGDGLARAMVEKVVCTLLRGFFSVRVPDANAPFRLMKASLVEKYIDRLPNEYDLPNIMLTAYFARFKENITFKTVSFKPRTAGTNSINLKKIFRIGKESLSNFMKFRKDMKEMDPENARAIKKHKLGTLAITFTFIAAALFAISVSPSSPFNRSEPVVDSSVFLTVGTQIKNGQMPYLDTFDHKGPFLYVINFLGVLINPTSGILIFEFIALFAALIYMYKISRLFVNKRAISWFLTLAVFSLYFTLNIIDRGNLTEEYAFPFVAMALYEFIKYLMKGRTSLLRIFMVGVGFACVLMLRVNMVAIWGVFGVAILIKLICEKKYKELLRFLLTFVAGAAVIIVPIMIWLISRGAFKSFIDVYLIFNAKYTKGGGLVSIYKTIEYFFKEILLFAGWALSFVFLFIKNTKNNKYAEWAFFIAYTVAVLAACVSGRSYPHYGMVLIPLPIVAFSWLYKKILAEGDGRNALIIVVSLFLAFASYLPWMKVVGTAAESFAHRSTGELVSTAVLKSCEYIDKYTDPGDKIAVYGNMNYVYLRCNRLPASRYSYLFPIADVNLSILDEFFDDVVKNKPKVFVIQGGYVSEKITTFLSEQGYEKEWVDVYDDGKVRIVDNTTRVYILREAKLGK